MPEHAYLTPIPDSTSESIAFSSRNIPQPHGRVPYPLLHSFYSVSLSSQEFLQKISKIKSQKFPQAHFERAGTVE